MLRKIRRFWRRPSRRDPSLAAALVAFALFGASNTARSMIQALARDAGALLDARSPGERPEGALYQTKLAHRPHSRVLSETRTRPPAGAAPAGAFPDTAAPLGEAEPPVGALANGPGAEPAGGGPLPLAYGSPAPIGGGVLPFDETPAPVPEPDTYAMLGIGIGMIGAALRRRRASVSLTVVDETETAPHPEA